MTDVMASLFIDVHPSKAILTLFRDSIYFIIIPTVSAYSLLQMLLRVVEDGSTGSLCNALYDCHNLGFNIVFHGIYAETNRNMR